jgi:hypothetical protein
MLRKIIISIIVSCAVFFTCVPFLVYLLRPMGAHSGPFHIFNKLRELEFPILHYQAVKLELPQEKEVNDIINQHYQKDPNDTYFNNYDHNEYILAQIPHLISKNKFELQRWNTPPVFIRDQSLPQGFGFYLEGEDGISRSRGRDLDDINSWDITSKKYYVDKSIHEEAVQYRIIAIFPALLTFIYIITRKKKTFSSKRVSKG